jgi:ankyrin repeat protein
VADGSIPSLGGASIHPLATATERGSEQCALHSSGPLALLSTLHHRISPSLSPPSMPTTPARAFPHLAPAVSQGFNPDSVDYDGRTALMLGCARGHPDVVALLLQAGE